MLGTDDGKPGRGELFHSRTISSLSRPFRATDAVLLVLIGVDGVWRTAPRPRAEPGLLIRTNRLYFDPLGVSCCSELSKHHFEQAAAETGRSIPGARVIGSLKTANFASSVSWFWPANTTRDFAWPKLGHVPLAIRTGRSKKHPAAIKWQIARIAAIRTEGNT